MAKHMISIAMILIPDYINYASTCMLGCFNLNLGNCNEKKWQLSLYTSHIGQNQFVFILFIHFSWIQICDHTLTQV